MARWISTSDAHCRTNLVQHCLFYLASTGRLKAKGHFIATLAVIVYSQVTCENVETMAFSAVTVLLSIPSQESLTSLIKYHARKFSTCNLSRFSRPTVLKYYHHYSVLYSTRLCHISPPLSLASPPSTLPTPHHQTVFDIPCFQHQYTWSFVTIIKNSWKSLAFIQIEGVV